MDIIIIVHRLQGYYHSQKWVERSYHNNSLFEDLKIITIKSIFFSVKKIFLYVTDGSVIWHNI